MFIRRTAATILVDARMAVRSGSWIVTRTHNPHPAMDRLEGLLSSPASDDAIADAVDALHLVIGQALMAGDLATDGFEEFDLADIHPDLLHADVEVPGAANDVMPLRRAA